MNRIGKFRVINHKSARSVMRGYFEEDATEFGGTTFDGKETTFTFDDVLAGIETTGLWGYSDKPNKAIHVWFDRSKTSRPRLINFFTHELFHLFGWPLPKSRDRGIAGEVETEERAANLIGDLAEVATKTVNRYKF